MKIRPPLPFSGRHAEHFLAVLSDVLRQFG